MGRQNSGAAEEGTRGSVVDKTMYYIVVCTWCIVPTSIDDCRDAQRLHNMIAAQRRLCSVLADGAGEQKHATRERTLITHGHGGAMGHGITFHKGGRVTDGFGGVGDLPQRHQPPATGPTISRSSGEKVGHQMAGRLTTD